jgi:integrase
VLVSKATRRLTAAAIETLRPGRHHDGAGLYLQVTDLAVRVVNGEATPYQDGAVHRSRSWVLRYTLAGKSRHMGLGSFPGVGLAEARKAATEVRVRLQAVNPVDPMIERKKNRKRLADEREQEAVAAERTFGRAAEEWMKLNEKKWTSSIYREQTRRIVTRACEPIWKKPVRDIVDDDAVDVLRPVWDATPVTARTLRMHMERILGWAAARKWRNPKDKNPARWKEHIDAHFHARSSREVKHHPALPYVQAPAFASALRARETITDRALEFLLLTCVRTGDVIGARWKDIDFSKRTWTIPETKTRTGFKVPLSTRAVQLLQQLHRVDGDDHLFPGRIPGRGLNESTMLHLMKRLAPGYVVWSKN